MLNRSGERGHPCLVPDLSGKALSFCPLNVMLAVGVSYMALIMLRTAPFIPTLLSVFIRNGAHLLLTLCDEGLSLSMRGVSNSCEKPSCNIQCYCKQIIYA